MIRSIPLCLLLLSSPALAQQSTLEQALAIKLQAEINSSLQCSVTLIEMQKKLADVEAQIKVLKDKYEPANTN